MSKITIDDLPFAGAELTDAELGDVAGSRKKEWQASAWTLDDVPYEWWLIYVVPGVAGRPARHAFSCERGPGQ